MGCQWEDCFDNGDGIRGVLRAMWFSGALENSNSCDSESDDDNELV